MRGRTVSVDVDNGSLIFRRVHEFLVYLGDVCGRNLITRDILRDDKPLRDAMFTDLTNFWSNYTGATVTRGLHSDWRAHNIPMGMGSIKTRKKFTT